MSKEKPNLKLHNQEGLAVSVFVDNDGYKPWEGCKAFDFENEKPLPDGKYTFSDGRTFDIEDGVIQNFRTYMEIKMNESMEALNNKFDALTEAILELAKAKQNG